MTAADLFRFVTARKLGVLGTIGPEGRPQSALVGYGVTEELEIVFDTVKSTRKYGNLVDRPECSFVIGWDSAETVQYEGIARELTGSELEKFQRVYFTAWPDGPDRLSWPGIVYFAVRPTWIRYSDFAVTPTLIQEWTFD